MTRATASPFGAPSHPRRGRRLGALLGMAGVSALWAVLLFALALAAVALIATAFAAPIGAVLGLLGIAH